MLRLKKNLASPSKKPETDNLWKSQKGFTLTELMVALAIFGIIAATLSPTLIDWNQSRKVVKDARDFYSNLHLAKLAAIREDCDVVVTVDTVNDTYEAFLDDGGTYGSGGTAGNETRDGDERVIATAGASGNDDMLQFGGSPLGFSSRGIPLNGLGTVVFSRADQASKLVWYRTRQSASGHVAFEVSTDSTDGDNGNWTTQ